MADKQVAGTLNGRLQSEGATARAENATRKPIKLTLQMGGSHGAFTWGVIDRLLEHGGFEVEAVVGTSAGAVTQRPVI